MNKGSMLLFLLIFGVASSGQIFAQAPNGTSREGFQLTEQQKKQVSEKRPTSVPKEITSNKKATKGNTTKKMRCAPNDPSPYCLIRKQKNTSSNTTPIPSPHD